jgi:anti-sigma factor RsiW
MNNDKKQSEQLAAYADGELYGAARQRVEAMLAESAEHRKELRAHQDLRLRVHYVVSSEPLPEGLRERVLAHLRALAAAQRWHRQVTPLRMALAAAALIVLVVGWRLLSGDGNPAPPAVPTVVEVSAEDFARIHHRCADESRHDEFKVGGMIPAVASHKVLDRVAFAVALPDLSSRGYALHGACLCTPQPGLQVLHVFYRPVSGEAGTLSVFSTQPPIRLRTRDGTTPGARTRVYELAHSDGVHVLKWDEAGGSFALCTRSGSAESLLELADATYVIEKRSPLSPFATTIAP